jgi:thiamine kinase-like enzyme
MRKCWLRVWEVEQIIRQKLNIPPTLRVKVEHANYAKMENQKFFLKIPRRKLIATFYFDKTTGPKEEAIIRYLTRVQKLPAAAEFIFPQQILYEENLMIRKLIPGKPMRVQEINEKTIGRVASLLTLFQKVEADELSSFPLKLRTMTGEIQRDLPRAYSAFKPFRGSGPVFDTLQRILDHDWRPQLKKMKKNFVHGDLQPQNILMTNGKIALIDYDRGGYFYPLFDVASFAMQSTHTLLLDRYKRGVDPNRREIHRLRSLLVREYRRGGGEFDELVYRLFKVIILFQGLAFSTGGFKKSVQGGRKHLLFGLFRNEVKGLAHRL